MSPGGPSSRRAVGSPARACEGIRAGGKPPYNSFTPLNRLIDATLPESDAAREFRNLVDRMLAGGSDAPSSREKILNWLTRWRANDAAVAPTLERSYLLQEAMPLSKDIAALAKAGIDAVGYLGRQKPPVSWTREQLAFIEGAKKPRAELLIMIAPSIEKLVEAATNQR